MKICQFTPYFPPHKGGLENVAENISKYLVKEKFADVINITSSLGQETNEDKQIIIYKDAKIGYWKDGYQVICIPSIEIVHNFPCPKFRSKKFRKIMSYIRTQKVDIIQTHTRFFLQTFLGGIVAKRLKKKWVHVEHGSGFVTGIAKRKLIIARIYDQTLGRIAFSYCNKIVSINQTNIQFIKKFVSAEKCSVIYNGIENTTKNGEITIRNNTKIKLAYIGRLIGLKGVHILINSYAKIKEKGYSNISLDIIGDGDEKENLQQLAHKLNLDSHISFLGAKDHKEIIETILPKIDILINPSFQEGLPTTVLEGLLSKCVVVATDVGGTKEISEKDDLLLVKAGNIKDLQEKIEHAIENHIKLHGKSLEGVINKFNRKTAVSEYQKIYTELTEEHIASIFNSLKIGGGVEKVQANLSLGLTKKGYKFSHILLEDIQPRNEYGGNIIVLKRPFIIGFGIRKIISLIRNTYKICKICKKKNISILIGQGDYFFMISGLTKLFGFRGKTIAVVHTTISIRPKIINFALRCFLKLHDKIILISQEEYNRFINEYGFKKEKLTVIYNAIETEKIELLAKETTTDIVRDKLSFINVGRLNYQKGQERLLHAFNRFHKDHADSQLIILGDGELKENLTKEKNKLESKNDIHLLGNKTNVYKYITKADCFVLSSNFEGFPVVLIEAICLGIPIISTDCPTGPRELLLEHNIDQKIPTFVKTKFGYISGLTNNAENNLYLAMKEFYKNKKISYNTDVCKENFSLETNISKRDNLIKSL